MVQKKSLRPTKATSKSLIIGIVTAVLFASLFNFSLISLLEKNNAKGELIKTEATVVHIEKYIYNYDYEGEAEYARRAHIQYETSKGIKEAVVTWGFDFWCDGMKVTVWYDSLNNEHVYSLLTVLSAKYGIIVSIILLCICICSIVVYSRGVIKGKKESISIKEIEEEQK